MKFPLAIPSEIIVFWGIKRPTIFLVGQTISRFVKWYSENVRFFCPTCVCYTRGWLPGVWEPFLSFRFPATIRSRGPRGRAAQFYPWDHFSDFIFVSDLTSHEISCPCSLQDRFFFETIKSHEISFPCSLQDFFWRGKTTIKSLLSTRSFFWNYQVSWSFISLLSTT